MDLKDENLGKPKMDDTFRVLHEKAHEFIVDQHEYLANDYGFGQFDRYTIEESSSEITFFSEEKAVLKLAYQIVGSLDQDSQRWSWRWADEDASEEEIKALDVIKNYGDFYDFNYLTIPSWESSTDQAWAMTVISAYLRTAKGIFRLQQDEITLFVYFKEIIS
ncbi:MAG: DUF6882 domain-containing protein [Sphingobacterium sp.]